MCYSLGSPFKIQLCNYLTENYTFISQKKNLYCKILREESKKSYLNIVTKS